MHPHLLHNGRLFRTHEKLVSPGQIGYMNGWGVFSTIRVFDGVLFAFERHWARMTKDAALMRVPMPPDAEAFRCELLALVEANQAFNATLRVAVVRNRGGFFEGEGIERDCDVVAFTTGVQSWGRAVRLSVQPNARHSACMFAGAKILSWSHNLTWIEMARSRGCDEVILLDEHGRVSECTSANIFAWTGDAVLTPPLDSGCLAGVTRDVLLQAIQEPAYPVREQHLRLEELFSARSVFITSTTRELLAVTEIDGRPVPEDDSARLALQAAFSAYVDRYVREAKTKAGSSHENLIAR